MARAPLFERLGAAGRGGVGLVCAPPGSGKTVLLRSWIDHANLGDHTGWVSVEHDERDAQRFWLSVIDELRGTVGADAFMERLTPTPDFDGGAVVDRLVANLGSLEVPVVLVIDDLHELRSIEALAQLKLLLSLRPPLLSVVLASRHDPQLGLHRLRLTGELTELRAADLAFGLEETRMLLGASGIALSDECLAVLHARTEGWAAGLRLAAISLAGHPEPERFVAEFSGSERTVAEYLLAEVLERQPDEVRRLLLCTSVLERVSGALADHLVGDHGSERILHALEQANVFVVAVDAARSWFRYHQLFADLLRLELRRTQPELIPQLHDAAASWHAEHGYVVEAVRHAQAAENWQYAGQLLGEHALSLALDGRWATVDALLAAFPHRAASNPELAPVFMSKHLRSGSVEAAAASLAVGERGVSGVPADRRRSFEVRLAVMRLGLAVRQGDFGSVVDQVRSLFVSVEMETPDDLALGDDDRAVALLQLGIAEMRLHRMAEAGTHLGQALELARRGRRPYLEAQCLARLPVPLMYRSPSVARERALEAIAIADKHGWGSESFVVSALTAAAGADVWQARFEDAKAWLARAEQIPGRELDPTAVLTTQLVRGMLHDGEGRYEQALAAYREAEQFQAQLVTSGAFFRVLLRGFVARMQVRLGDVAAARASLDELSGQECESGDCRVALALVDISDGNADAAVHVLGPVFDGSAAVFHVCSLVEAFLLDALAHDMLGDMRLVERNIERALELAEPDELVWPFVITHSKELLDRHPRQHTAHAALISRIYEVLSGRAPQERGGDRLLLPANLTAGELRVLRYLSSNFSAPEIGAELYLSVNTVKTHMRHIYEKLGVRRRADAIERAHALGLLPAPSVRRRRTGISADQRDTGSPATLAP
jgi:LuxR family maltose regulon positive regulatory protein